MIKMENDIPIKDGVWLLASFSPFVISRTLNSKLSEGIRTNKKDTPWSLVPENYYPFIWCPWYTILIMETLKSQTMLLASILHNSKKFKKKQEIWWFLMTKLKTDSPKKLVLLSRLIRLLRNIRQWYEVDYQAKGSAFNDHEFQPSRLLPKMQLMKNSTLPRKFFKWNYLPLLKNSELTCNAFKFWLVFVVNTRITFYVICLKNNISSTYRFSLSNNFSKVSSIVVLVKV